MGTEMHSRGASLEGHEARINPIYASTCENIKLAILASAFTQAVPSSRNAFSLPRRDQDGGVGGHGVHLSPQARQKYVYVWNNSHRKLTRNWQKNCTIKAARKICT